MITRITRRALRPGFMGVLLLGLAFGAAPAPALAEEPAPAHGAAEERAAAAHKPSVFEGGIGNALITLLVFGIVVAVLGKFAWPELLRVLNERENAIRISLENARKEREDAEALLAKYKQQIDHARQEATAIVEEGRRDADEVRRRMQEDARKETAETLARAKREIQLATDAAVKELFDRTADMAVQVAGRIIRKELNAADHQRLVQESLSEMQAAGRAKLN